ncbi:MAG: hypothetical protein QOG41_2554 [Thermoleophilaceae bacterium]|nr:hypothetical protein [Thermoleophilaceae bacterium]
MSREGRTGRRALVAAAVGVAALAATASSGASGTQSAGENARNSKPVAALAPRHARVRVGKKILLDASRSRDADGRILYHLWDLDGDGVFERSSGRHARIRHAFRKAGTVRIGVAVIDDDGGYAVRHARVKAVAAPAVQTAPAASSENIGAPRAHVRAPTREKHRAHVRSAKASPTTTTPSPTVTAASSTTVVIKDFAFKPITVTVNVGDTVTWRNDDTTVHTATADDGSFDTGPLSNGSTGQFRFEKAGTFKYHCTPHATTMKATVVVKASGTTSTDSGGTSPGNSSGGSSGNGSNHSSLPHTGLEIAALLLAGLLLLGAGTALRRRLARS